MSESPSGPVELYRARSLFEAHMIRLLLEAEGIPLAVENESLQSALGELPLGWSSAPRIVVNHQDEAAARKVLDEFRRREQTRDTVNEDSTLHCLACGAVMAQESTCRECGWTYGSESVDFCSTDKSLSPHVQDVKDLRSEQESDDVSPSTEPSLEVTQQRPPLTESEIRWEVAAVLAVGVIPNLSSTLTGQYFPKSSAPYWVGTFDLCLISACALYATLYLIYRSGESWERFGITRFRVSDLFLGLFLVMVARVVHVLWWELTGGLSSSTDNLFPVASSRPDYVLMVVTYGVSGLSEEVITRAYLITRLERLFRSRLAAVLVAATLFASYHLYQGVDGAFYALLFGLAYGGAFLLLRSVWPLAIGHALYNIQLELLAYG